MTFTEAVIIGFAAGPGWFLFGAAVEHLFHPLARALRRFDERYRGPHGRAT